MCLPNCIFGCHSNQSKSAFWTNCVYSVEDYSSKMSINFCQHICNELEIKAYFQFFPVRRFISLLHIYVFCTGLLLQFCFVISGLCLSNTSPEMTFTISSSSCIGIINNYFHTLLQRRLVQLFLLYKI